MDSLLASSARCSRAALGRDFMRLGKSGLEDSLRQRWSRGWHQRKCSARPAGKKEWCQRPETVYCVNLGPQLSLWAPMVEHMPSCPDVLTGFDSCGRPSLVAKASQILFNFETRYRNWSFNLWRPLSQNLKKITWYKVFKLPMYYSYVHNCGYIIFVLVVESSFLVARPGHVNHVWRIRYTCPDCPWQLRLSHRWRPLPVKISFSTSWDVRCCHKINQKQK